MLQDEVQREGAMVQDVCSSRAAHATRTNEREQAQAKRWALRCDMRVAASLPSDDDDLLDALTQSLTCNGQRCPCADEAQLCSHSHPPSR
jgi:hypothetical protein